MKCFCNMWQLSRIPCIHAMIGYMHMKMNPDLEVDEWYSQCKWYEAYQFSINPVYALKFWKPTSEPAPLPPVERKMHGSPIKRRIRHPTEDEDHVVTRVGRGIVFHEAPSSSMPSHTATPSTSNTMSPPPTPSTSNPMPPPLTQSLSTSNTMSPPSVTNTMPPAPKPYVSNTMPSQ
ncbi:hypothetical protein Tco_1037746, partial [Tanacetum coccineum]